MLASKRADGDLRNGLSSSSVKTRFLRSNLNFIPQFFTFTKYNRELSWSEMLFLVPYCISKRALHLFIYENTRSSFTKCCGKLFLFGNTLFGSPVRFQMGTKTGRPKLKATQWLEAQNFKNPYYISSLLVNSSIKKSFPAHWQQQPIKIHH